MIIFKEDFTERIYNKKAPVKGLIYAWDIRGYFR
jgi:hypothetical protein